MPMSDSDRGGAEVLYHLSYWGVHMTIYGFDHHTTGTYL